MTVKIYTTKTCPWCKKTKEFLQQNKIKYTEMDISANQNAAQEMIKKSGQMGVPVIVVTDTEDPGKEPDLVIGFDERTLRHVLEIK